MSEAVEKRELTVSEAGRLGGNKRKAAGADYSELGKLGGAATRERHGEEFYSEIGTRGGEACKQRHGADHYHRIGKKGGQRVAELIAKGKASE